MEKVKQNMFPVQSRLIHSTDRLKVYLNEWSEGIGDRPVKTIEINWLGDPPQLLSDDIRSLAAILIEYSENICTNYRMIIDDHIVEYEFRPKSDV